MRTDNRPGRTGAAVDRTLRGRIPDPKAAGSPQAMGDLPGVTTVNCRGRPTRLVDDELGVKVARLAALRCPLSTHPAANRSQAIIDPGAYDRWQQAHRSARVAGTESFIGPPHWSKESFLHAVSFATVVSLPPAMHPDGAWERAKPFRSCRGLPGANLTSC